MSDGRTLNNNKKIKMAKWQTSYLLLNTVVPSSLVIQILKHLKVWFAFPDVQKSRYRSPPDIECPDIESLALHDSTSGFFTSGKVKHVFECFDIRMTKVPLYLKGGVSFSQLVCKEQLLNCLYNFVKSPPIFTTHPPTSLLVSMMLWHPCW